MQPDTNLFLGYCKKARIPFRGFMKGYFTLIYPTVWDWATAKKMDYTTLNKRVQYYRSHLSHVRVRMENRNEKKTRLPLNQNSSTQSDSLCELRNDTIR
jgi:hypothetical protein